jgi:hypothetical protein
MGKATFAARAAVAWPGGLWSVQPSPEGPQQRLASDAQQLAAEETSLV